MSDLRIRSEAASERWVEAFLPPQVDASDRPRDDEGDFAPFLTACARALGTLFGAPVEILPARPRDPAAPRIAAALAGLLAGVRMGGDATRPAMVGGIAQVRYARIIADTLDACAVRVWPAASTAAGYDLDISCGAVSGHAYVPAPPPVATLPAAVPEPLPQRDDLPLRLRVELASDLVLVSSLLPLRAGCVLPISPRPEMPLIIGDHRIGRVTVVPHANGSQQASIVAIGVEHRGERP